MEIRNEVKERPKKRKEPGDEDEEKKFVRRSLADIQRAKLEKLMSNPDKPIIIPERPKERDFSNAAPTFVRNVMGSSAGAGSGEFHVYRNLRRKEFARLKGIEEKSRREEMDMEYESKLEMNRLEAEEKTAKKREKRQKKKQKIKNKKPKIVPKESSSSEDLGLTESEGEDKLKVDTNPKSDGKSGLTAPEMEGTSKDVNTNKKETNSEADDKSEHDTTGNEETNAKVEEKPLDASPGI